jgi:hypothetical protein
MNTGSAGILPAIVCILLTTFDRSREAPFFLARDFLETLSRHEARASQQNSG